MKTTKTAHLKDQGKEWRNLQVFGQEINQLTSAIGKMNLFLQGIEDFNIVNDDTLKAPAFIENATLKKFDCATGCFGMLNEINEYMKTEVTEAE